MQKMLTIIGSGPAALTAALYAARAGLEPLVIEGKDPGGLLATTNKIGNWPGIISIHGATLVNNMQNQVEQLGTRFLEHEVTAVDFKKRPFRLVTHKNQEITAQAVIIATGASSKKLRCPGEDKYWAKGVATCAVCDGFFYKDKPVIIVGGDNRALENVLFMTNYTRQLTIVQPSNALTGAQLLRDQILSLDYITIIYDSIVTEIHGDNQRVTSAVVTNLKNGKQTSLETRGVFISIGSEPNTALFKNQLELTADHYIKLTQFTETSCPGVFAAGEVADNVYRLAITAAGSGCMAALDAEKYLKNRTADG